MKTLTMASAAGLAALVFAGAPQAGAQEDYIGEIIMTGANFCPRGTLRADGQLLPIAENSALFSLYGTQYGGDGRTSFALPDLRVRTPVHAGTGPDLGERRIGSRETIEVAPVTGKRAEQAAVNGGPQKVANLAINYCVVTQGIYPSRN